MGYVRFDVCEVHGVNSVQALPMLPRRSFSRKDRGPKPDINMWWTLLHYVQVRVPHSWSVAKVGQSRCDT